MLTERQKLLMFSMAHGYCLITLEDTKEEYRDSYFYKQALEVNKFFKKKRPVKISPHLHDIMEKKKKELIRFDADYFADREMSAFICMLYILQYLIEEERDLELRMKFGHWNFLQMMTEINKMMPEIELDANKYITALLNKVKGI